MNPWQPPPNTEKIKQLREYGGAAGALYMGLLEAGLSAEDARLLIVAYLKTPAVKSPEEAMNEIVKKLVPKDEKSE